MGDPLDPPLLVMREARALGEGGGVRFRLRHFGVEREAFAVRWRGRVFGYLNACRHENLPLDFGDARFFDDAYDAIVCCQHGARYDPASGACLDGPCSGGRLTRLVVEERAGALWCLGGEGAGA